MNEPKTKEGPTIEQAINRADMVLMYLDKNFGITFKLPMLRCRMSFLGSEFVWRGMPVQDLSKELSGMGFDNLKVVEFVRIFRKMKDRYDKARAENQIRAQEMGPEAVQAKRERIKEHMQISLQRRIRLGEY